MRVYLWLVQVSFIAISAVANAMHGNMLLGVLPVALAIAVSIIERVPGRGAMYTAMLLGAGAVALASAVASYVSMVMFLRAGADPTVWPVALLVPFGIDGIILASSMALLTLAHQEAPEQSTPEPVQEIHTAPITASPVRRGGWVLRPAYSVPLLILPLHPPVKETAPVIPDRAPREMRMFPMVPEAPLPLPIEAESAPDSGFPPNGDALLIWERHGSNVPTVRALQAEFGWGSTRATNAARDLRTSLESADAKI